MRFDVAAEAYDRFKGRYSALIAPQSTDFAAAPGTVDVPTYGRVAGNSSATGPSPSPGAPGRRVLGPERIC